MDREPFSNAPDPDFYFNSKQHTTCFQKLEIALRLKRGLNVVIGDIGTGKTTLCRKLIQVFSKEENFECHLILDPFFDTPQDFLREIAAIFNGNEKTTDGRKIKELIKLAIFNKAKVQNKNLILIIDEGQKLPLFCLEILREFLNFETNNQKLLQIVIFAQKEFTLSLEKMPNFADRINLLHILGPMSFKDTRAMIAFRVQQACSDKIPPRIFSFPALLAIHFSSKGHPRKIINICHQSVLAMIIQNRSKIGWRQSRTCIRRAILPDYHQKSGWAKIIAIVFISFIIVLISAGIVNYRHVNTGTAPVRTYSVRERQETKQPVDAFVIDAPKENTALKDPEIPVPVLSQTPGAGDSIASLAVDTRTALENKVQETDSKRLSPFLSTPPDAGDAGKETKSISGTTTDITPPPSILGETVVRKNDTIGALITVLYGEYKNTTVKTILKINPHITDPDHIKTGDAIRFPAISKAVLPDVKGYSWIKIDDADTLSDALDKTTRFSGYGIPLRIASIFLPDGTFSYDVLLKTYFSSDQSANNKIRLLPLDLAKKASIISKWPKGAVILSDLLAGGKNTGDL